MTEKPIRPIPVIKDDIAYAKSLGRYDLIPELNEELRNAKQLTTQHRIIEWFKRRINYD